LPFTDAGHGWLIFALPPGELGIHPTACGELSLYQPRHASPLKP
jgi:hypothetical protein